MEEKFLIGYGRTDITPETPVPMGGYGNPENRINEEVRDPLYGTCLAFTDPQGNTVLLYTTDAINCNGDVLADVRKAVSEKHGIPQGNIMLASTHSHSTPALYTTNHPSIPPYRALMTKKLVEAADAAMADRKPSDIYAGKAVTERLNFIRHYVMTDGTYAGSNFGTQKDNPPVGHTSENDPIMQLIKIVQEGGQEIILMNWQAHPCFTGGISAKVLSADYIGDIRKFMEEKTGARFAFFQGAAGNHNARSWIKTEQKTEDPVEYAALLGEYALNALANNMTKIGGNEVAVGEYTYTATLDHIDDHLVEKCKEIRKVWQETFDRTACNKLAREIGLNSIYAVTAVIGRSERGTSEDITIRAFRVGNLGFACAPYEMFGVNGQYVKDNSPMDLTFMVSCCNGAYSYLASELAFSHGCYEVDVRRFAKGTAEDLAKGFVQILKDLKG